MNEASRIMSGQQAQALAGALPPRYRLCGWTLLYSTDRHGISLQTLYRRCVRTLSVIHETQVSHGGCMFSRLEVDRPPTTFRFWMASCT